MAIDDKPRMRFNDAQVDWFNVEKDVLAAMIPHVAIKDGLLRYVARQEAMRLIHDLVRVGRGEKVEHGKI